MKRPLRPEERQLWAAVASTVARRAPRRPVPPTPPAAEAPPPPPPAAPVGQALTAIPMRIDLAALTRDLIGSAPSRGGRVASAVVPVGPEPIEPNRKRRIVRGREGPPPRLDLHGYGQDMARTVLTDFLLRAQADGHGAALVITGKGRGEGQGVIRRRTPEWLNAPPLRAIVAGVSPAHPRHGGEGALYVALKRR